ncbi:MAG: TonB-dependent receptor domain-containing protein [Sphingorhabdus sp.]
MVTIPKKPQPKCVKALLLPLKFASCHANLDGEHPCSLADWRGLSSTERQNQALSGCPCGAVCRLLLIGAGNVKITRISKFKYTAAPLALGLALVSTPSFAQDAAEEEAENTPIVVTGSLIKRPNEDSAAPVTVVGGDDFKDEGATKVEDLLNKLPQVLATQSSGVSNGADGTATVSLRGLGTSRSLVLVDGRRLMPGGIGGGAAADLNFIPSALISQVELLTGGASSTYGADAVAGVVNFKMNREFQGVRLDGQYSFYQHNNNNQIRDIVNQRFSAPRGSTINGGAYDVSIAIGSSLADDRGNIVAYAGLRSETAITQDKYDYSVCTLNPSGLATGTVTDFACGGSGTPAATRFGGFSAANTALAGLPAAGSYTLTGTNSLIPYVGLRDAYNFAPLNYYRRPSTRYTAGVFADYEINEHFNPYLDVMFMDYSTKAQIAPSGAFFGVRTINCNNPFINAGGGNVTVGQAICGANLGTATNATFLLGKRNVEGGPRFNDIGFNQFRVMTGMRGEISDSWSYDVYAQFGKLKAANTYRNDVSNAKINEALLATGTVAAPVCTSGNAACVPYNPFQTGGISSAQADFIGIPLVQTGTTKETIVNGTLTGDFGFAMPWAEDNIAIALGAEWRKEELATQPDQAFINGDGAGQGGPTLPIDGAYSVRDLFAEVSVPIVQDATFFQNLSLDLGFRNSSYSVRGGGGSNSENTWKIGANWSPVDELKIRGSINRAVRSPNIGELFSNSSIGLFAGTDPCVGAAPTATVAQCQLTGLAPALYGTLLPNTAQQYNGFFGGNLGLTPEKADSWTAGFVFTPTRNISLSVDYYDIKVKNAIGTIGAQVILNQCIATADPFFCSKINRSTRPGAVGSLWLDESGFVDDRTTNTGSIATTGVDVNADARFPIGENTIRLSLVGNYVKDFVAQPITGGFKYDCAGFYGLTCGNPQPTWKHVADLKFSTANDFAVTFSWRYVGKAKADFTSSDPDLNAPGSGPVVDEVLKAENYFDLLFSVPLKDTIGFRLGVNNILDNDPPLVSQASLGGFGNGNVFPGTYDHLGRYVFVGLTADF